MSKFFPYEIAAHAGEKHGLNNVNFKKNNFENSEGAEQGTLLEIIPVHIKNPPVIQFMAFLKDISDTFNSQYTEEQPFGRTDPYYIWKSSKRNISINLDIPSSNKAKALDNLNNLSWLLASLYPTYKEAESATSISATPLFRVRYSNIIASRTQDGQGVLCVIKSANVVHKHDKGYIFIDPVNIGSSASNVDANILKTGGFQNSISEGESIQISKLITLRLQLDVVHDHQLGWDHATGEWRGGITATKYPYGFGLQRQTEPVPTSTSGQSTPGNPDARAAEDFSNQLG